MEFTWDKIIVWLIVGGLAGSLAGLVVKRKKEGFGHLWNFMIGLVGALIGGILFGVLKIDLGLANIKISLQEVLSAFVGSLILLGIVWIWKKQKAKKAG